MGILSWLFGKRKKLDTEYTYFSSLRKGDYIEEKLLINGKWKNVKGVVKKIFSDENFVIGYASLKEDQTKFFVFSSTKENFPDVRFLHIPKPTTTYEISAFKLFEAHKKELIRFFSKKNLYK